MKEFNNNDDKDNENKMINEYSALRHLRYEYFRSTVFNCMSLLGK